MIAPPCPTLPTLRLRASWLNRAGRVDRSACIELDVRALWRRVATNDWRVIDQPRAAGCIAHAELWLDASQVRQLTGRRLPRVLIGDFRTPKANAMKADGDPQRRRRLRRFDVPWRALDDPDRIPFANPNHGAAACKRHGLDLDSWCQRVRIERWIRGRLKSPRVFAPRPDIDRRTFAGSGLAQSAIDRGLPPRFQHYMVCPRCRRKVNKLFAPLASKQELRDAAVAERWLLFAERYPPHMLGHTQRQRLRAAQLEIINRYGMLFGSLPGMLSDSSPGMLSDSSPPDGSSSAARRFVCRVCLGIRYGEVKKSRRNGGACTDPGAGDGAAPGTEQQRHEPSARQWKQAFQRRPLMHQDKALYLSNARTPRRPRRRRPRRRV